VADELPRAVTEFIRRYVSSVEQLEILLLLRGDPERAWTADEVARELATQSESAFRRLDQLAAARLLVTSDGTYRYEPDSRVLAEDVEQVADTYARRRHRVITAIFSDPRDPARRFSDQFRRRR
jgi:predicted transcriptional regulator